MHFGFLRALRVLRGNDLSDIYETRKTYFPSKDSRARSRWRRDRVRRVCGIGCPRCGPPCIPIASHHTVCGCTVRTKAVVFPFDLFGSGGTGTGAQLLGDALREMIDDTKKETKPVRQKA